MARRTLATPWQEHLDSNLCTPEQAVACIKSGDHVWIPPGGGSASLLSALAARRDELRDVHIRCLGMADLGWFGEDWSQSLNIQLCFCGIGGSREALNNRLVDYYPYWMHNNHKALDAGRDSGWQIDVCMVSVSEPNNGGYCSFGGSVWDGPTSARRATTIIAVINPNIPETYGESYLHVSEFDHIIVEANPVPAPRVRPPVTDVDRGIAANIASIIRDGDTIQIGLGTHTESLPGLGAFDDRHDLSYFGEMTVPGIVDLVQRGVINGRHSVLNPGQCAATMIGNSPEDYQIIHRNPSFAVYPLERQANPRIIAQNEDIVAINGALTIDLSGQIGVGSIGPRYYAGLGGHLAYAMGATLASRGRYVCVIPSTSRDGTISTITPQFPQGQIVSVPRELADTVVTEYGVARLLGRSVRERAEELIAVAHPDFRAELRREAQRLLYP